MLDLDIIDKKRDMIISYFVKFYGEDKRDFITERINNLKFISFEFDGSTKGTYNVCLDNDLKVRHDILLSSLADDFTLFHEINHALETEIDVSLSDNKMFYGMCGFDEVSGMIGDGLLIDDSPLGEVTLFNEVINEKISKEIVNLMHDDGNYIYGSYQGGKSSYDVYNFIIDDFYNDFKDEIIKSRQIQSLGYLKSVLGPDNVDDLISIMKAFHDSNELPLDMYMADALVIVNNMHAYYDRFCVKKSLK